MLPFGESRLFFALSVERDTGHKSGMKCVYSLVWMFCFPVLAATGNSTLQQEVDSEAIAGEPIFALRERLENHIAHPRFARAAWGIKVVSLETGKVLFEHQADKLLKPASNAKLYTGALMFDRFGPDHRITTSFFAATPPGADGIVRGDLIVFGRGDPSFAGRFAGTNALAPLVNAIVSAGVKRIEGNLVGDESYYWGAPFGGGWSWADLQYYYGAEVSALTMEDNVIDLVFKPGDHPGDPCRIISRQENEWLSWSNRTVTVTNGGPRAIQLYRPVGANIVYASGSLPLGDSGYASAVTVSHPAGFFIHMLGRALEAHGIVIEGDYRTMSALDREIEPLDLDALTEIASVESRPMSELIGQMMKPSQNLYAQLFLLHAGANHPKADSYGSTEEAGLAVLNNFLARLGVPAGSVLLEEGSGLSRGALLAPSSTVFLLEKMYRHRHAAAFRQSLPVAGVEGTLRNRMHGTAAAGNARAKTGSLRYVSTLSGYVSSGAKEPLAFSIMLNNYHTTSAALSGRNQVDAVLVMLAEFAGHSGASVTPEEGR
jgi:serine-type D-Ala-D-Ala carboxypeptidase/endopeptidase (penicillin-binding protein 4)